MASGCRQASHVRYTNWRPFERVFSNGKQHTRYIREIVFGQRGRIRYYHLTTDPHTLPAFEYVVHHDQSGREDSDGYVMLLSWISSD